MGKRWDWLDRLLLAAIICLSAYLVLQLWGLGEEWWRTWPRPGAQVDQQYVGGPPKDARTAQTVVDYLLYLPPKYHSIQRWPLVVFLHGSGECGENLDVVRGVGLPKRIEAGELPEAIVVSPQCLTTSGWQPETVVALVEYLSTTLRVDRDRVYLTGFSMGAFGTWRTACYDPERFAAIAPVSSGGNVQQAKQLAKLPVWAFHGAKDSVIPLAASQEIVGAVRDIGGRVEFTVYPDCGHGECGERTYQNPRLLAWLLAQRRGYPQDGTASGVQGK